jgi:hypothetical protein
LRGRQGYEAGGELLLHRFRRTNEQLPALFGDRQLHSPSILRRRCAFDQAARREARNHFGYAALRCKRMLGEFVQRSGRLRRNCAQGEELSGRDAESVLGFRVPRA